MGNNVDAMLKSIRTGQGLRDVLFDEIDSLRAGTGDRQRALAIASLAHQIINSVKVEIEYLRQVSPPLGNDGLTKRREVLGDLPFGSKP